MCRSTISSFLVPQCRRNSSTGSVVNTHQIWKCWAQKTRRSSASTILGTEPITGGGRLTSTSRNQRAQSTVTLQLAQLNSTSGLTRQPQGAIFREKRPLKHRYGHFSPRKCSPILYNYTSGDSILRIGSMDPTMVEPVAIMWGHGDHAEGTTETK